MNGRDLIHYTVTGHGSPIIFVHGGLGNGTIAWKRTAEAIAPYHKVLVVDRRGHGRSPIHPRPYTIESDAQDVLAAATAEDLGAFHLVGHSYGGVVALEVVRLSPKSVLSLHLIEPPILSLNPTDPAVMRLREHGQAIWHHADGWDAEQLATEFLKMVAGETFVQKLREWPVWPSLVAEAERMKHEEFVGDYHVHSELFSELPTTQVYTGGRSDPGLRRIASRLASTLPGAKLIDIAEAYHDVHKAGAPFEQALLEITNPITSSSK